MSKTSMGSFVKTYYADIYIGMSCGYEGVIKFTEDEVLDIISKYIDNNERKFAVNIQNTTFVYPGGMESGLKIGLIQYPRFEVTETEIFNNAVALAIFLVEKLDQFRCSLVTSNGSYLIENGNMPETYEDRS